MTLSVFVAEIFRWLIGMLLLAAVFGKLRRLAEFRRNLVSLSGLPERFGQSAAAAVIGAEAVAAAMILGGESRTGMWLALFLFVAFTALLSYKFVTVSIVRCSCFGESGRPVSGFDLLRNVLVIMVCLSWLGLATPIALPLHAALLAAALASVLCVMAIEFHGMVILLVNPDGN